MTDRPLPENRSDVSVGGREAAHDEAFDALAVGWALHALDAEDEAAFTAHLAGCAHCRTVVEDTIEAMGVLAAGVPDVAPPAGLRSRLQEAVTATEQVPQPVPFRSRPRADGERAAAGGGQDRARSGGRRVTTVLLAAAAAAVVGLGVWNIQLSAARDQAQARASAQAEVVQALLDEGPGTLVPIAGDDGRTVATVFQRDGSAQLVTHGLSANDRADSVYVLWGLGSAQPEALGTFDVDGSGPSVKQVSATAPPEGFAGYAISLEPGRSAPPAPTVVVARTLS